VVDELLATLANVVDTPHAESAREAPAPVQAAEAWLGADSGRPDLFGPAFHELRSPLTAISGQIQRARRLMPLDAARATDALDRALAQVDRMTRLLTDVLDHARLDANALTLTFTTFDLGALIAETIGVYDHAETARVSYERPAAPVAVRGDPDRIQQILGNLLENALKYSAPDTLACTSAGGWPSATAGGCGSRRRARREACSRSPCGAPAPAIRHRAA